MFRASLTKSGRGGLGVLGAVQHFGRFVDYFLCELGLGTECRASFTESGKPTIYIGDQAGEIPTRLRREGCGFARLVGNEQRLAACIGEFYTNALLKSQMGQKATVAMAQSERLIAET
ncbi:MAG: hypothetical protein MN733_06815 [Nitrososphaera sp.]|nr:hypothetical protein [Nitrososphaera sp.]